MSRKTTTRRVEHKDGRIIEWRVEEGRLQWVLVSVRGWHWDEAFAVIRKSKVQDGERAMIAAAFAGYFQRMYPHFNRERFLEHALGREHAGTATMMRNATRSPGVVDENAASRAAELKKGALEGLVADLEI